MRCGLLGKTLGHSYSPQIHARLADYEYRLFEKREEELADFLKNGDWDGLNVTIPYKKTVVPYCSELSGAAKRIGSVNTLVRRPDGTIFGDNTDVYGFLSLVRRSGAEVRGEKTLVLGSGGASASVCAALETLGAEVVVISRSGENDYENLDRHADAAFVVNTTPLGMYPKTGEAAVDLKLFPRCRAVFDVVYNPARTALLMQAETLGIPGHNGLHMLVAQAKRSCELFCGKDLPDTVIDRVERALAFESRNIVLIGMPGCGKTTVAGLLKEKTGRRVVDADKLVEERAGMTIPEIFAKEGEKGFRLRETEALAEAGKASGTILASGGGCVTREENYPLLHQNGVIVWLRRDAAALPREGRPLSQNADLERMYAQREPLYRRFADAAVENDAAPEVAAERILELIR